ncbi:MBA1-like protein-domain-containing protein [Hyaloscypha sp. PMI_1271]|nr:MBA1-like protein-domain-containing protein [Hyaloscypha sp. PMI_1271]
MAHCLRRPLFSAVGLSPSFSRRCFSQLPALRAGPKAPQPSRPRQQADRSIRVLSKGMQAVPSDIGLLDMTFITPTGSNRPPLFKRPLAHLKYQWKRFAFRFRDQFSLIILWYSSPKEKNWYRRSVKLSRSTLTPTAVALHRQMYNSFAEGDVVALRKICADGLYDSFRARIGNRPRGEKVDWELVDYNKRSKLISNRAARLPIEGAAVIQAVVRIASRQKLTRWVKGKSGSMEVVPGSGKEKDVVEYVVLQRQYEGWREGEWQVWGTTQETTLDDVEEWERKALA